MTTSAGEEAAKARNQEDAILKQEAALEGKAGALLWSLSAEDGTKLADYQLEAPPVFDGMAAAGGKVYLTTVDGKLMCLK